MLIIACAIVVISLSYLGAYAVAYSTRRPAANMAYFAYASGLHTERFLSGLFLPVYRLHRWFGHAQRHNLDRPDEPVTAGP